MCIRDRSGSFFNTFCNCTVDKFKEELIYLEINKCMRKKNCLSAIRCIVYVNLGFCDSLIVTITSVIVFK